MTTLMLATSSPYRIALLKRLGIPFTALAADINEAARPAESAGELVLRLAQEKCMHIAMQHPQAVVLGSDQVAELDGEIVTKSGDHTTATAQLRAASGKQFWFHTGLACYRPTTGDVAVERVSTKVSFRELSDPEIEHYLKTEQPYDCAGSFKCEGLGIALFDAIESDDPTALIGLPLIASCRLLRKAGLNPLLSAAAGA